MAYEAIIYEKPAEGVARITLNRPEVLNALTLKMIEEIGDAAADAARDPAVSVLIYRGAGRAFCVGRDFKERAAVRSETDEDIASRFRGFGPETWLHPKATIAEVQGFALGGGNNLAIGCDITIASEGARFGYPEQRYGTLPNLMIWNYLMSPKRTKEYLLTGANFDAEEAYVYGLVNHVVAASDLESTSMNIAHDIATIEARYPGHIRANKTEINDRHPELLVAFDPHRGEENWARRGFLAHVAQGRDQFDKEVSSLGVRGALEKMHSGYSSDR